MRRLTDHIVDGDSANHQLAISVTDEIGAGGANHRYEITGFSCLTNPSAKDYEQTNIELIFFQNGPIKEAGVNGVTQEALLAIIMDRLKSFQAGPYASVHNANALSHCEAALSDLQARTRQRIARGVEGTHVE